jgi:HAD superfamily hydrolase (TIGR01549 family)
MNIRGVIFDLGGTLLRYHPPGGSWEDMEKTGGRALHDLLGRLGYSPPPLEEALEQAWRQMQTAWLSVREANSIDPATLRLAHHIRLLLGMWGISPSEEHLVLAERAYTCAAQAYVRPVAGAAETLRTLVERGFPVGLISNTLWRGIVHRYDLSYFDLWPYLQFALFSSDELAWKPHPAIFERALALMNLPGDQVVYVGDSLFFDVYGAQQAGLHGAWIRQTDPFLPPTIDKVAPDLTVEKLPDLLRFLELE